MYEIFDHQILSRNAFGLVDAAMLDELPQGIKTEALVPPDLAASAHLMPRLIDFRKTPHDRLDGLLACLYRAQQSKEQPPVALLVKTDVSAQEFARYWNALQLAVPQPKRRVWLRLHDPRVLHQMLRIVGSAQRRKLFGQSASFTYWIGNEWVIAAAQAAALGDAETSRWDWARIELIGSVNRALLGAGVWQAAALTRHGALAEQLIERARARHGLVDQADMVEFAMRGLTTSATFDEHPKVACVIRPGTGPDEESSLSDRLALIDEHIWSELRQTASTQKESDHDYSAGKKM